MSSCYSVTENGFAVKGENHMSLEEVVNDTDRVEYFQGATDVVKKAIEEDGVDIRSYLSVSFSLTRCTYKALS